MITIKKNPNFPSWLQIFSSGNLIDEVTGRAKALRIASQAAKKEKSYTINFLGKTVDIRENI